MNITSTTDANVDVRENPGVAVIGDTRSSDGTGRFADDSRHQDVNGDGSVTVADVTTLFNELQSQSVQNNVSLFDFNDDQEITFANVTTLFYQFAG